MNVLLRTCPFCGAIPNVYPPSDRDSRAILRCSNVLSRERSPANPCPVGPLVVGVSIEEVSRRWNTRVGDAVLDDMGDRA